jgi:hypothetical protein
MAKNNGHGGARKGAGRKRKSDEEKVRRLGENAIIEIYGSLEKYYEHIAKESKDSFPHLKLLQEYVFGKAPDRIIMQDDDMENDFDLSTLSDEELIVLTKLHARQGLNTEDTSS